MELVTSYTVDGVELKKGKMIEVQSNNLTNSVTIKGRIINHGEEFILLDTSKPYHAKETKVNIGWIISIQECED